jgi:aspartokinase
VSSWKLTAKQGGTSVSFSQAQEEAFQNVLDTIAPSTKSRLINLTSSLQKTSEDLWPTAHNYKTEKTRKDGSTYEVLIRRRSKGSKEKHTSGFRMDSKTSVVASVRNTAPYSFNIKTGEPKQPLSLIVPMGKRVAQFLIFSPGRKKKTVDLLAQALTEDLQKSAGSDRPITRFKALFKQGKGLL